MNDFYNFFDLPFSLAVDLDLLRKRYYENSRKYHPDFHTQSTAEEQEAILSKSTANNRGFEILSDRNKRIKYILDFKDLLEEGNNQIPQEFLMEMMDFNESLMDLQMDFNPDVSEKIKSQIIELADELYSSIASYEDQRILLDGDKLEEIKNYYLKNQYLKNLQKKIEDMA